MPEKLLSDSQQVPYQAYKSKRHSRNLSNPTHVLNGFASNGVALAVPRPRPSSFMGTPSSFGSAEFATEDKVEIAEIEPEDDPLKPLEPTNSTATPSVKAVVVDSGIPPISPTDSLPATLNGNGNQGTVAEESLREQRNPPTDDMTPPTSPLPIPQTPTSAASSLASSPSNESSAASSSTPTKSPQPPSKRMSTFRRVPLRSSRTPLPSSPLRPAAALPSTGRVLSSSSSRTVVDHGAPPTDPRSRVTSLTPAKEEVATTPSSSSRPMDSNLRVETNVAQPAPIVPPPRVSSLNQTTTPPPPAPPAPLQSRPSSSSTPISSAPTSPRPGLSSLPSRIQAPYRPGFQPKGVYRPRTDEFFDARREAHNSGSLRIERTKLERRLEKLIALHFPEKEEQQQQALQRPSAGNNRRSSFFDLDLSDLKSMDPSGLWKNMMMQGTSGSGGKGDIRAAEQRITPWEDDSAVNKCPLCRASFHPLTNRKHHCRLCGQIVCALPVKNPQRPVTCSLLFVVDKNTRMIEEVSEGVDYGVRKRRTSAVDAKGGKGVGGLQDEEEKFLKGVRMCRTCRPILTRQQYQQESTHVPTFVRLYDMFITLEKEIEASLPQFEELLLSLTTDDHPTKEAMAARKRLLEAFAQYDALSKRIRNLPCPSGPGSSQDRVQMAVMTRANLFLQKHMFPLQTIPKKSKPSSSTPTPTRENGPAIDPDSKLALALQPLLEQEALLESFIEEANAHRKFEDVKTLQANLKEIRSEIDRIVANSGDHVR
ncbi:Carboxypeptidase Y-deficient [Pleurotus pulmonarius]|nr:carboxypeptidase Y-deficient [Pleurotus pulmonarius]